MNNEIMELIEAQILYNQGIEKALVQTMKGSIFTKKYNKGYYDAVKEQLKKLNEMKLMLQNNRSQNSIAS